MKLECRRTAIRMMTMTMVRMRVDEVVSVVVLVFEGRRAMHRMLR